MTNESGSLVLCKIKRSTLHNNAWIGEYPRVVPTPESSSESARVLESGLSDAMFPWATGTNRSVLRFFDFFLLEDTYNCSVTNHPWSMLTNAGMMESGSLRGPIEICSN